MKRVIFSVVACALLGLCAPGHAADAPAKAPAAKKYSPPRTFDGKPDLQGIWANNNATPLERPKILEGRAELSPVEVDALRKRQEEIFAGDGDAAFGDAIFEAVLSDVQKYKPTTFDASTGNYNAFWLVERDFDNRTSLVTDPSNGKIPPMLASARERNLREMRDRGAADGPESRTLSERCITYGLPSLLAGYNSYYQIVQTQDTVMIFTEMVHDARVIHLDGRPHASGKIRDWYGDSRGKWEGDSLVVETKNLRNGFRGSSADVRMIERFTRVGPNTINYEVTVDDPSTWAQKWTLMIPLKHKNEQIYEYACHEGNSSLAGILAGAREEERRAAKKK
ncbi:MAG TPA: hypothetical protein VK629_19880 [Steroidobacteraceae bacterium]|nr:hypothetical protein [Steroidobacteraceae bacterium]